MRDIPGGKLQVSEGWKRSRQPAKLKIGSIGIAMTALQNGRCVHCLGSFPTEQMTEDHVPPSSWYPDTTPASIQYWKVPSCRKCISDLGRKERALLVRFGLCIDPSRKEASGLASRAPRTLGLDTKNLIEEDRAHRDRAKARIRKELMYYTDVADATVPGLGPPDDSLPGALALPIAYSDLSHIAEKLARGFEYKRAQRYVERHTAFVLLSLIQPPSSVAQPK